MMRFLNVITKRFSIHVPWPSPGVYTKEPVVSADDMNGLRIRSFNATSFTFLEKMGAAPVELPFEELATAVAAGTVDGAATSTSTGANSKLYQFTGQLQSAELVDVA